MNKMKVELNNIIFTLTYRGFASEQGPASYTRRRSSIHRTFTISCLTPEELAKLRDYRIKASVETVTKSLVGDYRAEHIFTLKQSLNAYRYYQQLIADCDQEVQQRIESFENKDGGSGSTGDACDSNSTAGTFDLRAHFERSFAVDLTAIPGFDVLRVRPSSVNWVRIYRIFQRLPVFHPG